MAGSILVLGPSQWEPHGKARSRIQVEPLGTRRGIAAFLRERHVPALLLEDSEAREGETHTRHLFRVLQEGDVQTFLVYWPLGARLHGLDKEFGHLTEWLERGHLLPEQVILLTEAGHLKDDSEAGVMSINEPGNRTRWYEDLFAYGCSIRVWDDERSLHLHVLGGLIEHVQRQRRDWFVPVGDVLS